MSGPAQILAGLLLGDRDRGAESHGSVDVLRQVRPAEGTIMAVHQAGERPLDGTPARVDQEGPVVDVGGTSLDPLGQVEDGRTCPEVASLRVVAAFVSRRDPALGERNAKLQLVLFSDFECPACQRFARALAGIRNRHPELAVVFKHYPLGKACNAGIRVDLHPLSCDAACAAEAARRQGKFWEYHDALFAATQSLDADLLRKLADDVGLDRSRFEADVNREW